MGVARLKKLQSAGWKIGNAKDFLALSNEETMLVELKLSLADAVRQSRQKRGLSQIDLAQRMGSSQSRVAKMEAGDQRSAQNRQQFARARLVLAQSRAVQIGTNADIFNFNSTAVVRELGNTYTSSPLRTSRRGSLRQAMAPPQRPAAEAKFPGASLNYHEILICHVGIS